MYKETKGLFMRETRSIAMLEMCVNRHVCRLEKRLWVRGRT